jgi:hypothetical protein
MENKIRSIIIISMSEGKKHEEPEYRLYEIVYLKPSIPSCLKIGDDEIMSTRSGELSQEKKSFEININYYECKSIIKITVDKEKYIIDGLNGKYGRAFRNSAIIQEIITDDTIDPIDIDGVSPYHKFITVNLIFLNWKKI